ncbi:MAG TPA: hypothetical protein PLW93_02015 [Candidatus Absconditabacterales bacterium]|nr:hypothetical protein [Candidatus Absconditabacterales bacterium]HNG97025.1 hypothetical protein [Candidatus Absconditabacterales bacterium]
MTISAPNVGNTLSHMSALEHIQFKAQLFAKIKKQITLFNTYGEKDRSHSGKDKGTQTLITMIGLNSLNDAIELAGDNDHIINYILNNKILATKYQSILEPVAMKYYTPLQGNNEWKKQYVMPDDARDNFDQIIDSTVTSFLIDTYPDLYHDICLYYHQFLRRKTLDGVRVHYDDAPEQFQLESLLHQMVKTKQYNLMGVKSSMQALLSGMTYKDENKKDVWINYGESSVQSAITYLQSSIRSHLPKGSQLKYEDSIWKIVGLSEQSIVPEITMVSYDFQSIYRLHDTTYKVKNTQGKLGLRDGNPENISSINYQFNTIFRLHDTTYKVQDTQGKRGIRNARLKQILLKCLYDTLIFVSYYDGVITLGGLIVSQHEFHSINIDSLGSMTGRIKQDLGILNRLSHPETYPDISQYVQSYLYTSGPNVGYWGSQDTPGPLIRAENYQLKNNSTRIMGKITACKPTVGLTTELIQRLCLDYTLGGNTTGGGGGSLYEGDRSAYRKQGGRPRQDNEQSPESHNVEIVFDKPTTPYITTVLLGVYTQGVRHDRDGSYQPVVVYGDESVSYANRCRIRLSHFASHRFTLPCQPNNFQLEGVYQGDTLVPTLSKPNGIQSIAVSSDYQEYVIHGKTTLLSPFIPECSTEQYEKFRAGYLADHPDHRVALRLPDECEIFLEDIASYTPKDKVRACESFVRDVMWYDYDNLNNEDKSGKPLDEQLSMCYSHKITLIGKYPALGAMLQSKLFVGVCEDAANLLYVLLNRAGIICGQSLGYARRMNGTWGPHGRNRVLFPGSLGECLLFEIDGTPSNYTDIQTETFDSRESKNKDLIDKLHKAGASVDKKILGKTQSSLEVEQLLKQHDIDMISVLEGLLSMASKGDRSELLVAAITQRIGNISNPHQKLFYTKKREELFDTPKDL